MSALLIEMDIYQTNSQPEMFLELGLHLVRITIMSTSLKKKLFLSLEIGRVGGIDQSQNGRSEDSRCNTLQFFGIEEGS
jgi:hypothetical protein